MAHKKRGQSSIQVLAEVLGGLVGGALFFFVAFKVLEQFFKASGTRTSAIGWAILLMILSAVPVVVARWYRIATGTASVVVLLGLLLGGFASQNPIVTTPLFAHTAHIPGVYLALGAWFAAAVAWRPLPEKEEPVDFSRPAD